mgnify:CR=1 FL=1
MNESDSFPHENKGQNAKQFFEDLFKDTTYEQEYREDFVKYLKTYGINAKLL